MSLIRHLLIAMLATLGMGCACAAPVTYSFTGLVDSDSADRGWLAFSGEFSFDSQAADTIPEPGSAAYAHAGAPWGMNVSFDDGSTVQVSAQFHLLVSNDLGGADQLGALAQDGATALSLTLFDFTQDLFASDALPMPDGGLRWADFAWSSFSYEIGNESTLQGHLTALRCSAGCGTAPGGDDEPGPHPVPEPDSCALLALALAALALTRRRPS